MNKLRCDSKWRGLSPEQRAALAGWLFDEGMGFAAASRRARQEFGVVASTTSLRRFYRREEELRWVAQNGAMADGVAASRALGHAALEVMMAKPEGRDVGRLARVVRLIRKK